MNVNLSEDVNKTARLSERKEMNQYGIKTKDGYVIMKATTAWIAKGAYKRRKMCDINIIMKNGDA